MSGRQEFTSTDAAPVILYTKKKGDDKGAYPLHPQYPLPISLDSIYEEDIDETYCTQVGWTGNLVDIFNSLHTGIYNDTSTNPKELLIYFHRTLYLNSVRLGCKSGKDFSNVKLEFLGNDGEVIYTYDDSADNTKYGNQLYTFVPVACIALKISFFTADEVGLTSISIQKEFNVASRSKEGFDIPIYDEIAITYTGSNISLVVYKLASVSVATLTLSYSGDNLIGVVKT